MRLKWSSVLALPVLAACSSLYRYEAETYVVRAGDTLYSIAFRNGLDARDIASWNGLADPDRIYVGQRLVLAPVNRGSPPPGGASRPAPAPTSSPRPVAARPAAPAQQSMPGWEWPTSGPVVARFGDERVLSTGVGIGGRIGQDIRAAAAGRVVYSGSGLPDYGQLVIIEHNDTWLSAYGHNRRVLVSQGQTVSGGQKIAEMGPGPGGEPRLHFEIRRNGDAIDPLALLPGSG